MHTLYINHMNQDLADQVAEQLKPLIGKDLVVSPRMAIRVNGEGLYYSLECIGILHRSDIHEYYDPKKKSWLWLKPEVWLRYYEAAKAGIDVVIDQCEYNQLTDHLKSYYEDKPSYIGLHWFKLDYNQEK